jgi:hypothetical protein
MGVCISVQRMKDDRTQKTENVFNTLCDLHLLSISDVPPDESSIRRIVATFFLCFCTMIIVLTFVEN